MINLPFADIPQNKRLLESLYRTKFLPFRLDSVEACNTLDQLLLLERRMKKIDSQETVCAGNCGTLTCLCHEGFLFNNFNFLNQFNAKKTLLERRHLVPSSIKFHEDGPKIETINYPSDYTLRVVKNDDTEMPNFSNDIYRWTLVSDGCSTSTNSCIGVTYTNSQGNQITLVPTENVTFTTGAPSIVIRPSTNNTVGTTNITVQYISPFTDITPISTNTFQYIVTNYQLFFPDSITSSGLSISLEMLGSGHLFVKSGENELLRSITWVEDGTLLSLSPDTTVSSTGQWNIQAGSSNTGSPTTITAREGNVDLFSVDVAITAPQLPTERTPVITPIEFTRTGANVNLDACGTEFCYDTPATKEIRTDYIHGTDTDLYTFSLRDPAKATESDQRFKFNNGQAVNFLIRKRSNGTNTASALALDAWENAFFTLDETHLTNPRIEFGLNTTTSITEAMFQNMIDTDTGNNFPIYYSVLAGSSLAAVPPEPYIFRIKVIASHLNISHIKAAGTTTDVTELYAGIDSTSNITIDNTNMSAGHTNYTVSVIEHLGTTQENTIIVSAADFGTSLVSQPYQGGQIKLQRTSAGGNIYELILSGVTDVSTDIPLTVRVTAPLVKKADHSTITLKPRPEISFTDVAQQESFDGDGTDDTIRHVPYLTQAAQLQTDFSMPRPIVLTGTTSGPGTVSYEFCTTHTPRTCITPSSGAITGVTLAGPHLTINETAIGTSHIVTYDLIASATGAADKTTSVIAIHQPTANITTATPLSTYHVGESSLTVDITGTVTNYSNHNIPIFIGLSRSGATTILNRVNGAGAESCRQTINAASAPSNPTVANINCTITPHDFFSNYNIAANPISDTIRAWVVLDKGPINGGNYFSLMDETGASEVINAFVVRKPPTMNFTISQDSYIKNVSSDTVSIDTLFFNCPAVGGNDCTADYTVDWTLPTGISFVGTTCDNATNQTNCRLAIDHTQLNFTEFSQTPPTEVVTTITAEIKKGSTTLFTATQDFTIYPPPFVFLSNTADLNDVQALTQIQAPGVNIGQPVQAQFMVRRGDQNILLADNVTNGGSLGIGVATIEAVTGTTGGATTNTNEISSMNTLINSPHAGTTTTNSIDRQIPNDFLTSAPFNFATNSGQVKVFEINASTTFMHLTNGPTNINASAILRLINTQLQASFLPSSDLSSDIVHLTYTEASNTYTCPYGPSGVGNGKLVITPKTGTPALSTVSPFVGVSAAGEITGIGESTCSIQINEAVVQGQAQDKLEYEVRLDPDDATILTSNPTDITIYKAPVLAGIQCTDLLVGADTPTGGSGSRCHVRKNFSSYINSSNTLNTFPLESNVANIGATHTGTSAAFSAELSQLHTDLSATRLAANCSVTWASSGAASGSITATRWDPDFSVVSTAGLTATLTCHGTATAITSSITVDVIPAPTVTLVPPANFTPYFKGPMTLTYNAVSGATDTTIAPNDGGLGYTFNEGTAETTYRRCFTVLDGSGAVSGGLSFNGSNVIDPNNCTSCVTDDSLTMKGYIIPGTESCSNAFATAASTTIPLDTSNLRILTPTIDSITLNEVGGTGRSIADAGTISETVLAPFNITVNLIGTGNATHIPDPNGVATGTTWYDALAFSLTDSTTTFDASGPVITDAGSGLDTVHLDNIDANNGGSSGDADDNYILHAATAVGSTAISNATNASPYSDFNFTIGAAPVFNTATIQLNTGTQTDIDILHENITYTLVTSFNPAPVSPQTDDNYQITGMTAAGVAFTSFALSNSNKSFKLTTKPAGPLVINFENTDSVFGAGNITSDITIQNSELSNDIDIALSVDNLSGTLDNVNTGTDTIRHVKGFHENRQYPLGSHASAGADTVCPTLNATLEWTTVTGLAYTDNNTATTDDEKLVSPNISIADGTIATGAHNLTRTTSITDISPGIAIAPPAVTLTVLDTPTITASSPADKSSVIVTGLGTDASTTTNPATIAITANVSDGSSGLTDYNGKTLFWKLTGPDPATTVIATGNILVDTLTGGGVSQDAFDIPLDNTHFSAASTSGLYTLHLQGVSVSSNVNNCDISGATCFPTSSIPTLNIRIQKAEDFFITKRTYADPLYFVGTADGRVIQEFIFDAPNAASGLTGLTYEIASTAITPGGGAAAGFILDEPSTATAQSATANRHTLTLRTNPSGPAASGDHTLTITASGTSGSVTETFAIRVAATPVTTLFILKNDGSLTFSQDLSITGGSTIATGHFKHMGVTNANSIDFDTYSHELLFNSGSNIERKPLYNYVALDGTNTAPHSVNAINAGAAVGLISVDKDNLYFSSDPSSQVYNYMTRTIATNTFGSKVSTNLGTAINELTANHNTGIVNATGYRAHFNAGTASSGGTSIVSTLSGFNFIPASFTTGNFAVKNSTHIFFLGQKTLKQDSSLDITVAHIENNTNVDTAPSSNGTLSSVLTGTPSISVGDYIILNAQGTNSDVGIYKVTDAGSASTPYSLSEITTNYGDTTQDGSNNIHTLCDNGTTRKFHQTNLIPFKYTITTPALNTVAGLPCSNASILKFHNAQHLTSDGTNLYWYANDGGTHKIFKYTDGTPGTIGDMTNQTSNLGSAAPKQLLIRGISPQ